MMQLLLLDVELRRRRDVDVHDQVAASRRAQVRHAQPAERREGAALGARSQLHRLRPVERLDRDRGAGHAREVVGNIDRDVRPRRAIVAFPDEPTVDVLVVTAVVIALVSLGGAVLGGIAGMRYHRHVDRAAHLERSMQATRTFRLDTHGSVFPSTQSWVWST